MTRLAFLDALRGLAALYVLTFHLPQIPKPALEMPASAEQVVMFGWSGVTLFFIISGFSLCLTMPAHERTGAPLVSFYVKRFLRIAPLFYVVVAAWTIAKVLRGDALDPAAVALNASFLFNLVPGYEHGMTFAAWTVGVEMVFYLVFPAVYAFLPGLWRKAAAVVVCAAGFSWLVHGLRQWGAAAEPLAQFEAVSVLHHLPIFLMGMLAFDLYQALKDTRLAARIGAALLVAVAMGFAGLMAIGAPGVFYPSHWTGALYAALVLGLALCPVRALVNRFTVFWGTISYSVYLWHGAVLHVLFRSGAYDLIYSAPLPVGARFLACLLLTVAITGPMARLSYRLIESPGIALSRMIVATFLARSDRRAAPGIVA